MNTGEKLKQQIIGQQTVYKSSINDGDTGNFRNGAQMRLTSRQPSSRNLHGRKYLPIPTSSNEHESLVDMSAPESTSGRDLEIFFTTSEPEELITTEQSTSTFISVQEKSSLYGKYWELRSFNVARHVTPSLKWQHNVDSNTDLVKLEKVQCGTAPDFSPCIPISQANHQFEQCCRSKLIPQNCLHMCKYDVTQDEITTVFSKGFCGLLYVVPIVQCASDGRDNSECCRYKQVIAKSAPQCEIFCRGQEITGLGLQHLVCRKVMDELIACHLSGLRN
ncbi:Ig-like and fibronectin type-III domain-containing protein [Dirofilaria immitis]